MTITVRAMANVFKKIYHVPGIVQNTLHGLTHPFHHHKTQVFPVYRQGNKGPKNQRSRPKVSE